MYEEKIYKIIDKYDGTGIARVIYKGNEEKEVYLDEELDSIFEEGIKHEILIENMFDNPGITIYAISISWIENGDLKSILTSTELY